MHKTIRAQRIDAYVQANRKDPGIAFLLAFLFGPIGFLYASVLGGVILILIAIGFAVTAVWPLNILIWVICMLFAPLSATGTNKKLRTHAELITPELGNTPAGLGENKARS